jgi:hypothetical protein
MGISDAEYYATRLETERRAANEANCDEARAVHQRMADLYADRLVKAIDTVAPPRFDCSPVKIPSPWPPRVHNSFTLPGNRALTPGR